MAIFLKHLFSSLCNRSKIIGGKACLISIYKHFKFITQTSKQHHYYQNKNYGFRQVFNDWEAQFFFFVPL